MNSVVLIGRLTRDPEIRYTAGTQMAVATFTVAIDRPVRAGAEKQTVNVFWRRADWLVSREEYRPAAIPIRMAQPFTPQMS